MSLTATDFFCGMGGSSTGLVRAGYDVKVAANHWGIAIETHSANHPGTEHLCADISNIDLRYLPRTDILWASPICTEVSPAGGQRKRTNQMDLFEEHGHVPTEAFERTRVTFWEVVRAAEIHRYKIILIENVVEASRWELFDVWLAAMTALGYSHQFVSVSAAHIGDDRNPHAPQWRDRLYIAFHARGVKAPDVDPRPLAWCPQCSHDVPARQWWKRPGRRIGKYGPQYIYVCPEGQHGQVEPYVAPAAAAIDWTNLGSKIGDRARPLAAKTMARIQRGLNLAASGALAFNMGHGGRTSPYDLTGQPMSTHTTAQTEAMALSPEFVMNVNHDGNGRHFHPAAQPLPTRSTKNGNALIVAAAGNTYDAASRGTAGGYVRAWPADGSPVPTQNGTVQNALVTPVVLGGAGEQKATPIDAPTRTQRASGADFLLSPSETPDAFIAMLRANGRPRHLGEPLATFSTGRNHGLVIPFRKGARPYPATREPLSTMATRDQHGVMHPAIDINDCHFRMLTPREAANAQAFPREYVIHGNAGEMQMQAGNAVATNVAAWLGKAAADALDGAA